MHKALFNILLASFIAAHCAAAPPLAAEDRISGFSPEETLTIRSAAAWMDEEPDIMHFGEGFELRATDWFLSSDRATLYGKLDDPETVVIDGSPAMIRLTAVHDGKPSTISGQAERIIYRRTTNSILMEGNASLSKDDHTMNGGEIEYDIERDHLRAGGTGGVHIRVLPDDQTL